MLEREGRTGRPGSTATASGCSVGEADDHRLRRSRVGDPALLHLYVHPTASSTSSETSRSSIRPPCPLVLIASSYMATSFGQATMK